MKAVDLKGIKFRYRGADDDALRDVKLRAEPGERVAVIGLTGAGKSTLLKCINRLVPGSYKGEFEGAVSLLGEDISDKRPAELSSLVGMVFQDFESQLFSTTAELDAAFGPENLGLDGDDIRKRVAEALKAVDMEAFRRRDSSTLSGGQKQRLAIASVLSLQPRILCLDEPTTDLDPEGRDEIADLFKSLSGEGITVILAEHEIDLLDNVDRIAGLERGRKVVDAEASEVLWDHELLCSLGVRPPGIVQLFRKLGISGRPRGVDEAADILRGKGVSMVPEKREGLDRAEEPGQESGGLINIQGLSHTYPNGVEALKDVTMKISPGEFVAILGKNGSGKTTLVKHINGLLRPGDGAVLIEGKDNRGMKVSQLGRRIGFVFQDPDHQIFAGRVYDEVAFAPNNYGYSESDVRTRVKGSLELVGLGGFDDKDPFLLTKGERQRVALASILSADPEVIILDEPTTGLDYPAQRAVIDLLAGLNREGRTIIIITHTLWVAAEYARRCLVMSQGRVTGDGPVRDILSDPDLLSGAGLRMPDITALGMKMGAPTLTMDEFIAATARSK
jgi:energy-coupling factor transport system ATP-binding protein